LGAVIFYFRNDLWGIINPSVALRLKGGRRLIWLVLVGTAPAALVGALFEKQIEFTFNSLAVVGLAFLVTAMLLFSTRFLRPQNKNFSQLKWHNAVFVGLFQTVAILPGVSRSGSTIVGGLWQGATRETAFRFSFYLAIPAILGALVLKGSELLVSPTDNLIQGLAGMVIAGVIGYFALKILEKVLKSAKFFWFGFYCLALGLIILLA
jgi:undecaprenyl-diphosphatase